MIWEPSQGSDPSPEGVPKPNKNTVSKNTTLQSWRENTEGRAGRTLTEPISRNPAGSIPILGMMPEHHLWEGCGPKKAKPPAAPSSSGRRRRLDGC